MGRKDVEYDPTLFTPPQFVHLMLAAGGSKPFEVYQDLQRNKELLQCDKCGKFLQLPGKGSVCILDNHHGKPICVNTAARHQRHLRIPRFLAYQLGRPHVSMQADMQGIF
jgi:hypothetical protein